MFEEGEEKKDACSPPHRFYAHFSSVPGLPTPNPLAAFEAEESGGFTKLVTTTTTTTTMAFVPPPHREGVDRLRMTPVPDPMTTSKTATSGPSSSSSSSSSSSAWTRGGGPGSIGPHSTTIQPPPSPLASPLLSPLIPPTPPVMSSFVDNHANENDSDSPNSAGTSESVMDAMATAMTMDVTPKILGGGIVVAGGVDVVGVGVDISQPILLGEREGEGEAVDYEPPTNRQRRNTIHWDTSPPTSHAHPSFRASAGAASAAASSAAASSASPDGGLFSHRHRPAGVPPPPSRFAASASPQTFGGLGGLGGNNYSYSHSSGSFHTEDCSESDSGCGSPQDAAGGGGGSAFGGAGGGWAAGAGIHRGTTTAAGGILATMNGAAAASAYAGGSSTARHATHASFAVAASSSSSAAGKGGGHQQHPPADKRQRRLERNRESARVSRRRRKHYLEELECRVSGLSEEMDRGRMDHARSAVRTVRGMRSAVLDDAEGLLLTGHGLPTDDRDRRLGGDGGGTTNSAGPPPPVKKSSGIHHNVVVARNANDHHRHPIGGDGGSFASSQCPAPASARTAASTSSLLLERAANALVTHLSRTSTELQVVQTFMKQHLLSLVQPTPTRFALWLSLQDDGFYRGGRSASERLSAARIGERLLHGGTDRALPNTTMMWPLVCHEISISYEQEEKVRGIQRAILSNTDGWIHRHTAVATRKVIEGVHDVVCGAQAAAGDRERSLMRILTPEQRVKFLGWARRRGDVIRRVAEKNAGGGRGAVAAGGYGATTADCGDDEYRTSTERHIAANLYIVNHLLSKVMQRQHQQQQERGAPAAPAIVVHPTKLKKLSRRPSFESLAGLQAAEDAHNAKLTREGSFPSAGSLKRSLSSMASMGDGSQSDSIDPNAMNFSNGGSNAVTLEFAQSAGQAAVMSVLRDVLPLVPREAWYNPPSTSATGSSTFQTPMIVTSQPLPMPQAYQPSTIAPAKPTSCQHGQQPQWWENPYSIPMRQDMSASRAVTSAQPARHRPMPSDIQDVDDIPMPTPVSVLLRTSDDYLMSSPVYEQEGIQLDTVVSSSNGFAFGAADDFSMPERTCYSSNTGLNRPQSAPQLEAFNHATDSSCPSFLTSQHMAMIPEMEAVMSHSGAAAFDHGTADFAVPEQINSSSSYIANTGLLGYRHSAPQFDTLARISVFHPDPSLPPPSPHMATMPEVQYTVPVGNDIIGEFAMLEEMNFTNQMPNMEADDWAIGEGFDDDMNVEGAT